MSGWLCCLSNLKLKGYFYGGQKWSAGEVRLGVKYESLQPPDPVTHFV